ncbi:MAG: HEAT repeat domain-containing protein [Spirochaetales bacterium]|jgi:HEAT repeat protein|nr:HEAT repeat domain-containing protein [Spirochaetales bacterium]
MKKRAMLCCALLVFCGFSLAAQAEEQTPAPAEAKTDEAAVRSLTEERRDIIKYGLETEIVELLAVLKTEKDGAFIPDFTTLLEAGPGAKTAQEIFAYFGVLGSDAGVGPAEKYLDAYEDTPRDILAAVLRYLADEKTHSFPEKIYPLLSSSNPQIAGAAVRYLGKKAEPESSGKLLELFKNEDTSQSRRGEIILALGDMKDPGAVSFLASLLADEDEDITLRRFACDSLGKIGDEAALPAIRAALESTDNILRAYAVSSLGRFPGDQNAAVLVSALRDSFPRIRELAAERLGDMNYAEAVDILIYRARRDPDKKVRQAALRSLSKIDAGNAVGFLQEFMESDRNAIDLRTFVAEALTDEHPSAMKESASRIMAAEWAKDRSPMLDAVCKLLSQKEYSGFDNLYEKMLGHPSFIIQIYGIRGVQKNHLTSLKAEIQELSAEGRHPQLRKNALSALEEL